MVDDGSKKSVEQFPSAAQLQDANAFALDMSSREGTQEKSQVPSEFPEGGLRAWCVAMGTSGVMFSTLGYTNAFGVYQEYYQTHQLSNKTPSDVAWIGSLQIFFLFGGNSIGGPLFDRYGAKIIWPAALAYILSIMLTSICDKYYQFILAQGVLGGIAAGLCFSPGMAATGQYFNKNRGAAMGAAVAGSSIGGVIFPIALSKMLANPALGFGWTVRICGFIILGVMILSCAGIRARLPPRKGQFFLLKAFKEPLFMTLVCGTTLIMLGVFTPIFYLPSYAVLHGMDIELSQYLLAILNGASFFGRLFPGLLADRIGRFNMFFIFSLTTGILILCWQAAKSNAGLIIFASFYGFSSGAIVSLMSVCFASIAKDARDIGTYFGMGMIIVSMAALTGPPINGAIVDKYNGFDQASIFSGVIVLAGTAAVATCKLIAGKGILAIV